MRIVKFMAILLCNIFIAAGCAHSFQSPTAAVASKKDMLLKKVKSADIYGMAVFVNEQPIIEYYKEGYDKNSKFPLYSCTKSIISALVGIAIEQGAIKSTEQYAAEFFPALNIQGEAQNIRLHHLLNQTSGLSWPEWSDPKLIPAFVQSKDWVRFVWERPMETVPGSKFNYSTGNSHVLSAILQQATGQSTMAYAENNLFRPLGISNFEWQQDPNGVYTGGFGISMTVPDMAKIGQLYLQQGNWQGRQLISQDWIKRSLTKQSAGTSDIGPYGYQWWIRPATADVKYDIYFASGFGSQYIFVIPDLSTVAVFTAWLSNEDRFMPIEYLEKLIIPIIEAEQKA